MTNICCFDQKLGVDAVYGMSYNDVFVLQAHQGETNTMDIEFLQDFNSEFSSSLGKTFDASAKGLGVRPWRFSLYAVNGKIEKWFEEAAPGEVKVSDADTMLNALK